MSGRPSWAIRFLPTALVEYHGQSIFAVAATSMALAREAAAKAVIEYEILKPILTIDEALAAQTFVLPTQVMQRGDADAALAAAPLRLSGRIDVGGQEHFYLEGQVAMAIPGEDGDMLVHSSTQHPTEVQHLVARALKLSDHSVVCETRRMGGGFGGKESQASLIAVAAALLAQRTGRPVKHRLDRDDDMILTGKRHHCRIDYDVGFDKDGRILGITFMQAIGCGYSPDLSGADRRPGDVPCGQCVLSGPCANRLASLQDQHRVQHGVSRVRRTAGHGRDRACGGRDRPASADRSADGSKTQFLWQERP